MRQALGISIYIFHTSFTDDTTKSAVLCAISHVQPSGIHVVELFIPFHLLLHE